MSTLTWIGTILAIAMYVPLCVTIFRGRTEQNLATWILWVALDLIASISLIVQEGNYLLPSAYVVGGTITVLTILKSTSFKWSWFESFITILVLLCIALWMICGPKWATILSSTAVVIAGLPQFVDTLKKPSASTAILYYGFTFANALNTLGGKSWTVEERLYPGLCTILCFGIAVSATRAFWQKEASGQLA